MAKLKKTVTFESPEIKKSSNLKQKVTVLVPMDTFGGEGQKNEPSQRLTGPRTRRALRPLTPVPQSRRSFKICRKGAQLKGSTGLQFHEQPTEIPPLLVNSMNQDTQLPNDDSLPDQLHDSDDEVSGEARIGTGQGTGLEEAVDENAQLLSLGSVLLETPMVSPASSHPHDSILGLSVDSDGPMTQGSGEPRSGTGLGTSMEEGETQSPQCTLSLTEYISSKQAEVSSLLRKLQAVRYERENIVQDSTKSRTADEDVLTAHRNNVQITQQRLDIIQQVEQTSAAFGTMAGPKDDTSDKQTQSLLIAASEFRITCQAAYERAKADLKATEMKVIAEKENVSRTEKQRQDMVAEIQAWEDWRAGGGRIFPG